MSTKPNVLLLVNSFDVGGAERQLLLLARMMLEAGHFDVHLACLERRGLLLSEADSLSVAEVPEFPLTSFYDRNMAVQLRRFVAFLRERDISVVHTDGFYTNVFGIVGAALARVPARVGFRGETGVWRTPAQNYIERLVFRWASVVHANSEAVKRFLVANGVPADRIEVVYNGLDMKQVEPPPGLRRVEALKMFGLPADNDRPLVTIVANMRHHVKDYPTFLRAARRVREAVPGAMFALAGEGEMMEQLRSLAGELGLERDAFFIGRCDRIAELLFASDVCVLSSKAEGFSNSILEYMGAARPVVATDVGGAREAIVEGETGYLVSSGDDETMASRISHLLREPQEAKEMGKRGRLTVQQTFSSEVQLQRTEELYRKLLADAATPERTKTILASPKSVA
jgi:L-malate glycosyltransferase